MEFSFIKILRIEMKTETEKRTVSVNALPRFVIKGRAKIVSVPFCIAD